MTDPQQPDTTPPYWKLDDPRGLLGQTRAVALMRSDSRASYKHMALIEFHWGWAHEKYDWTSLASVRRMHSVLTERNPLGRQGMTTRHINSGNRDLCEWGWLFELDKGVGRNASRFLPNYSLFHIADGGNFSKFLNGEISCSVSRVGTRNGYEILCIPIGDTDACTYEVNANRFSVSPVGDKDSLTETGLLDRSTEREIECAAPLAPPPTAGLSAAAAAGTAQDTNLEPFEELWRTYDFRQKKKEARAEYAKLSPDAVLHATMLEAAAAWQASWAAQNKPDAPRYTLAKWIEREDYECSPPTAFKAKERKAKKDNPENIPELKASGPCQRMEIASVDHSGNPFGDYYATIHLVDGKGNDVEHELHILSPDGVMPDNESYGALCSAYQGNERVEEALVGKPVEVRTLPDGRVSIMPATAATSVANNDNSKPKKKDQEYVIEKAHIDEDRFGKTLKLMLRGKDDGLCRPRNIICEHRRPEIQEAGMAELVTLAAAGGLHIGHGLDAVHFVGRQILITADNQVREPKGLDDAA